MALTKVNSFTGLKNKEVDSVQALQNLTGMKEGSLVYLTGRSATFTGGGGNFVYRVEDLSSKVQGDPQKGVYIPPSFDATGASGAWVRKYEGGGAISMSWFMADTTPTGFTNGLRAAITYTNYRAGSIKIPNGAFELSGSVSLGVGTHLKGSGNTTIKVTTGFNLNMLIAGSPCTISDITFVGSNESSLVNQAAVIVNSSDVRIQNCTFAHTTSNVVIYANKAIRDVFIESCTFDNAALDHIQVTGSHADGARFSVTNSVFEGVYGRSAIYSSSGLSAMTVDGCNFNTIGTGIVTGVIHFGSNVDYTKQADKIISNCSFYGGTGSKPAITNENTLNPVIGLHLDKCSFSWSDSTASIANLYKTINTYATGCTFYGGAGSCVYLKGEANKMSLVGCVFMQGGTSAVVKQNGNYFTQIAVRDCYYEGGNLFLELTPVSTAGNLHILTDGGYLGSHAVGVALLNQYNADVSLYTRGLHPGPVNYATVVGILGNGQTSSLSHFMTGQLPNKVAHVFCNYYVSAGVTYAGSISQVTESKIYVNHADGMAGKPVRIVIGYFKQSEGAIY